MWNVPRASASKFTQSDVVRCSACSRHKCFRTRVSSRFERFVHDLDPCCASTPDVQSTSFHQFSLQLEGRCLKYQTHSQGRTAMYHPCCSFDGFSMAQLERHCQSHCLASMQTCTENETTHQALLKTSSFLSATVTWTKSGTFSAKNLPDHRSI